MTTCKITATYLYPYIEEALSKKKVKKHQSDCLNINLNLEVNKMYLEIFATGETEQPTPNV